MWNWRFWKKKARQPLPTVVEVVLQDLQLIGRELRRNFALVPPSIDMEREQAIGRAGALVQNIVDSGVYAPASAVRLVELGEVLNGAGISLADLGMTTRVVDGVEHLDAGSGDGGGGKAGLGNARGDGG